MIKNKVEKVKFGFMRGKRWKCPQDKMPRKSL